MFDVPAACWLHPSIVVGASSIEGRGLFACADIGEGEAVSRLGGRLVTREELRALIAARERDPALSYVDSITLDAGLHLVLPSGEPNHYGNHSCDPNLWWSDGLTLVARRKITAGEELTNDYGTSSGDPGFRMPCNCDSALCRGVVTGADWSRPELQALYGRHWTPELLTRIDGRRSARRG